MVKIEDLNWEKTNGLIPCIVQDIQTKSVLMLAYVSKESLAETLKLNQMVFYSRTKNRLWRKGEESGNVLKLHDLKMDCDQDTLLAYVSPTGPVCHKGYDTCWEEQNKAASQFHRLEKVIQHRKQNPTDQSYTASLFRKGINKIAQKVGEEAVELVIESKDDNASLFLNEAADLMYHYIVLLAAKGFTLKDVENILSARE